VLTVFVAAGSAVDSRLRTFAAAQAAPQRLAEAPVPSNSPETEEHQGDARMRRLRNDIPQIFISEPLPDQKELREKLEQIKSLSAQLTAFRSRE